MPVAQDILGPASLAFPLAGAALTGGRLYVASRNVIPAALAVYDVAARTVVETVTVPTGSGAWGVTDSGLELVYIGQFGARQRPNIYRYRTTDGALAVAAAIDADYVWDLASAPDGIVYGVTAPDMVFQYHPERDRTDIVGIIDRARRESVRSIAATGPRLVVGGAAAGKSMLLDVVRATRARRSILPPALADHGTVYSVDTDDRLVAAGTTGPGLTRAGLAVVDLANPAATRTAVLEREAVVDTVRIAGDAVYCTARRSGSLYRYDRAGDSLQRLATPIPGAETRGLFADAGRLVGASAAGVVFTATLDGADVDVVDLLETGLEGRPELVQSLAAGNGRVYAGGNFGCQRHDLDPPSTSRFFVPGEPKDLELIDDILYLALYPGGEVWEYDTLKGTAYRKVVLPPEQNRPATITALPDGTGLLVGTASDRLGGGALHVYEFVGARLDTYTNPLSGGQSVAGVAAADGFAYLGGTGATGALAAFDLGARRVAWRIDAPAPDGGTLLGLVVRGRRLYGFTTRGWFLAVDLDTRAVIHRARASAAGGRLVSAGESLYGASSEQLVRFDPYSLAHEVVVDGLGARLWGYASLAADSTGAVYVIKGTDLLRVRQT